MSPVSSRKVSARGARVQVPFTLSDTCTRAGSPYWANHPTSRFPWATAPVSVTVAVETLVPVENAAPSTKLGVVDWATAARGSTTPRVAITARPAADRTEPKSFTVIPSVFAMRHPPREVEAACQRCRGRGGRGHAARAHVVLLESP